MKHFTREELYTLVWSKPVTHLAKEFGLSDVALHKICKKHDIPKPPLGWWAKKAAGKAVKQTPLPRADASSAKIITVTASAQRSEPDAIAAVRENAQVLASSLEQDISPTPNAIVERTVGRLRKAKPNALAGLVSVEGADLIKCQLAELDRLRRLVDALRTEISDAASDRVAAFLRFAEAQLEARMAALSANGLGDRLAELRLFGTDDDHDFRSPYRY